MSDEAKEKEQYEYYIQTFNVLVKELRIPFLDCKLFRKYFIEDASEENLYKLYTVVTILQEHKAQTVKLLRFIFEREQILNAIRELEKEHATTNIPALEVQTKALQYLYALQQVTLNIMEGIQVWRSRLSRPYPFHWNGVNYIFKILKDCEYLDSSRLKEVLPLQMVLYPLCSNLSTLHLFKPKRKETTEDGVSIAVTYPLKVPKGKLDTESASEIQFKLRKSEAAIFAERKLQTDLTKELKEIQLRQAFLTILDVHSIIPNCMDGIPLNNTTWSGKLEEAIKDTAKQLDLKP